MKVNKYFLSMCFAALVGMTLVGCSDDNDLGNAPRLFRPIASADVSSNKLTVTWDKISGATGYELQLGLVTATDEKGNNTLNILQTVTTENDTYTFENLDWDQKYAVRIKCLGNNVESEYYEVTAVSVNYPTKLSEVKTIDNAARITWKEGGDTIKMIVAVATETGDSIFQKVSSADYVAGTIDVSGLNPETAYTFTAYTSTTSFNSSTYAGYLSGTTKASVNFDEKYGAGMWLDIRNYDEQEAKDTLKSTVFWEQVKDGMTIILRGEQEYKVSNALAFDRSVTFVTGQTLGGNAKFISSGGMTLKSGASVDKVKFEDIDIFSDKYADDDELRATDAKGFGGRQVFNCNGTKATLKELIFKNCSIRGYRAIVRAQAATDNIQNITFTGCTINGIGDQGVVTTSNKAADWQNITFEDCTIMNVVMMGDLRAVANKVTVNVNNCTFCYAPMETTANANTPLFRFSSQDAALNISKCLFGPSMATVDAKGEKIIPYTAGTVGSVLLNGAGVVASAVSSFKTNFAYTAMGENATTYGIDGLTDLGYDETKLWNDPTNGDFKIIATLAESDLGASKWR